MPLRTSAEQHELRDYFRRAEREPNRTGSSRKEAFRRLLDLAKEPDVDAFCKRLVTDKVKDFFVDFPELQDEAINTVYDMCEDQDQEIRIAGYGAITSVSIADKSWLRRNADVLVQLLQSDDSREVTVVKRALQEHVDLDPRSTLQVLCDQCVFNAAELADDEDRMLRARLRGLVLQFLSEKYRVCVARVVREREVEEILLKGMIGAIRQASPSEVRIIVTDILVNLPSLSDGPTQNGNTVLEALLSAARRLLEAGQPDADKLSSILQQAGHITSPTSPAARSIPTGPAASRAPSMRRTPAADALRLLKFFADDALMQRVPRESGLKIVECGCTAYDSALKYGNKNTVQIQMVDAASALLGVLARYIPISRDNAASRSSLVILRRLQELIVDSRESYSPPSSLAAALKALMAGLSSTSSGTDSRPARDEDTVTGESVEARGQVLSKEANQAMELSRNLLKAIERHSRPGVSNGASSSRARGQDGQPDSAKRQSPGIGSSKLANQILASTLPNPRPGSSGNQDIAIRGTSSGQSDAMDVDGEGIGGAYDDASPQARKRLRGIMPQAGGGGGAPSLLSRLGSASPAPSSRMQGVAGKTKDQAQTQSDVGALRLRVTGAPADVSASVKVSSGGGELPSRTMGAAVLASARGVSSASRSSPAQKTPASVGVGGVTTPLSMNGGIGKSTSSSERGRKDQLARKELRHAVEPMGISILGASSHSDDEIKIRGAAERREGEDNDPGGHAGGGLSLLARLSNGGGGAKGDHGGGRKRKQFNRS